MRVGLVALLVAIGVAAVAAGPHLPPGEPGWVTVALIAAAWMVFVVAAWQVRRVAPRPAVALIVAGGLAMLAAASFGPPRSSDDLYRYVWDGRVQSAGIDPYRYAPADPELAGLREPTLWPATAAWCVAPRSVDAGTGVQGTPVCTRINRPTVHTIYPPLAEALFTVAYGLSSVDDGARAMQTLGALAAMATMLALLWGLRRAGRDPRGAAWWAWCPAVAIEAASNGHIDVVAAGLVVGALLALAGARSTQRFMAGGLLLGLAIATKVTPALVLPSVMRRRPVMVVACAGATAAALYVPHVLAVGAGVLGYLPGYLREEGYDSGDRFALLTTVVPSAWAGVVAVIVVLAAAVVALWTARPDRPWDAAALTVGSALLVSAPAYPWYALLLVALVALGARPEWLAVAAAGYVVQYDRELHIGASLAQRAGYGTGLAIMLVASALRYLPIGGLIRRAATRTAVRIDLPSHDACRLGSRADTTSN